MFYLIGQNVITLLLVSAFIFILSAWSPAGALEFPQHRTYKLSCLLVPDAGSLEFELRPHSGDPSCIELDVAVTFAGIAGRLSGMREQRYTTIMTIDPSAEATGIHHRQEVEVNHSGKRIRYAWEWQRNDADKTFVAQRFWGGTLKQTTKLNGGADVVSDLLSLLFRVGAQFHSRDYSAQQKNRYNPQRHLFKKFYTLLDPEGNIRVNASFYIVKDTTPQHNHVQLDFSRSPLTLGASRLDLWFSSDGEILRGRVGSIGGLPGLNITPLQ